MYRLSAQAAFVSRYSTRMPHEGNAEKYRETLRFPDFILPY
jgi:hypothetical protein